MDCNAAKPVMVRIIFHNRLQLLIHIIQAFVIVGNLIWYGVAVGRISFCANVNFLAFFRRIVDLC
ncbi:hypothetical protein D1872_296900 [compost metagenome]